MMQEKSISDDQHISKRRDKLLLILQIGFYLGYIGLLFVLSGIYPAVLIIKLICVIVSCGIKFYRQAKKSGWRQIRELQLGFLVVYLLTGFELVFSYQFQPLILGKPLLACQFITTIITVFNYSLLTNPKTLTKIEFFVYQIGIICMMSLRVKGTIQTIGVFIQESGGEYYQKFIILTATITIARGANSLQKIYQSFKASRLAVAQQKEVQTKREQMKVQLIQTARTDN